MRDWQGDGEVFIVCLLYAEGFVLLIYLFFGEIEIGTFLVFDVDA